MYLCCTKALIIDKPKTISWIRCDLNCLNSDICLSTTRPTIQSGLASSLYSGNYPVMNLFSPDAIDSLEFFTRKFGPDILRHPAYTSWKNTVYQNMFEILGSNSHLCLVCILHCDCRLRSTLRDIKTSASHSKDGLFCLTNNLQTII